MYSLTNKMKHSTENFHVALFQCETDNFSFRVEQTEDARKQGAEENMETKGWK
jgi:hypothetical protein